jgi:hypothetical protein
MFIIYASRSVALAKDITLSRAVIYDCNMYMTQATAEIVTYSCILQSHHFIMQATGNMNRLL